jgi:hypothetical protein
VRCARRARVLRGVSCVVDMRFVHADRASSPQRREQSGSDSRACHTSSLCPLKRMPRHRGGPVAPRGDEVRS